jgi:prevent-host-death family protein
MDVAVSELRAHLSTWLARVREGQEVVVTDRGTPVARLLPIGTAGILDELASNNVIARPAQPTRPAATGRARPRARRSMAEVVTEQRR